MKNQISVREAISAEETARFWRELGAYHDRDIFPDAESEEREYFHSSDTARRYRPRMAAPPTAAIIFSLSAAAATSALRSRRSSQVRTASSLFWSSAS